MDKTIAPRFGVSRDGQPLSYNRAPHPDLAPWIARLYATQVMVPHGRRLDCGLFNDTACLRIQLEGEWTAETAAGSRAHARAALFFGPQTRRMPVSVTGSILSIGAAFRPGANRAMLGPPVSELLDRIVPIATICPGGERVLDELVSDGEPEDWLAVIEGTVRKEVEAAEGTLPDPVTAAFETVSFVDPSRSIAAIAAQIGVEKRRLERIIRRDFGMSPKQVLRRARALDMASHLRGVADQSEGDVMALRYYDQSHLIREFSDLFGMSPRQFAATPQPILTLALESRQARRLEALERLAPGAARPWE